MEIKVGSLHSDEDIWDELYQMLRGAKSGLTLGMLMTLAMNKSPYVLGGVLSDDDIRYAYSLSDGKLKAEDFHSALVNDLNAAWRALEIIVPSNEPVKENGRKSQVDMFSPEWLADTISAACASVPSMTLNQVLWEVPLAMTLHLVVSNSRRHGAITERPPDIKGALKQFKSMQKGGC